MVTLRRAAGENDCSKSPCGGAKLCTNASNQEQLSNERQPSYSHCFYVPGQQFEMNCLARLYRDP
jgi:hypothetical protein